MTEQENAEVRKLISQGKSMKEIVKIMNDRKKNPLDAFIRGFDKGK